MLQTNVAEGVHRIEDAYTNWYLLEEDDRLTVVDCGVPTSWESLGAALGALGRRRDQIEAVVLTHAHFDHIGMAERARRELGVPVWVHENDVPLTRHPTQYARERSPLRYVVSYPKALPCVASFAATRAFFPKPIERVERYTDGVLGVPGSPAIVPTPGHTLGHCSLHFPDRGAVIAGDAVVMFNPYTARPGPQVVARAADADTERALSSLDALAALEAETVLTGHGPAWRNGTGEIVRRARAAGVQ